ncbi:uncharacterized protein [Eurosta solidaginis]|uniref:uncharacterized protein n=1 Tax=Eurosta solidaginis TaxID=178769 RepID=UPI0035308953
MAQSLAGLVGDIRSIDIKYKIHNFTTRYRKCKGGQGTGCSPASWKRYERVHRIIGNDRINNVEAVVMDSIRVRPESVTSASTAGSSTSSPEPSSPALSEASTPVMKKNQKISELNETIKTAMAENNKLTAGLIEIEKKKVAAIEMLSQSVVSFLERN